MKNKQLWRNLAIFVAIFVYLYYILPFDMIVQILISATLFVVPIRLMYSYLSPNQWLFNNHRRFYWLFFSFFIVNSVPINIQDTTSFYLNVVPFLVIVLITFGLGLIAEKVEKRYQNRKLADELVPEDERLVIDRGFSVEESGNQQGLLILSAGKLTFVYNRKNIEPKVIDIQTENLSISNFLLSPAGICTHDANFRVMFPRYWIKKIAEQKG